MRAAAKKEKRGNRAKGKAIRYLALASLLAVTAGCSAGAEGSRHSSAYAAEDADPKLAASMNDFALDFYAVLEQHPGEEEPGPNRMVSPAGLTMALSMLKGGAEGATAAEMEKALRLNGISGDALDEGQMILSDLLRGSDPSVRMEIANSLWSRKGFALNPDYAQRMKKRYGAEIRELDFSADKAVRTLNDWASARTHGKITKVAEGPISGDMLLLLMNAMYFKGDWSEPFEKSLTANLPFRTNDGQRIEVPTMRQSGSYAYLDGDGFEAIRLPYGESENFGMILALPDKGSSLREFLHDQLPKFGEWSGQLERRPGSVELPRFKLEDKLKLKEALIALGMPSAFDAQKEELGGLFAPDGAPAENLHLSFVDQKTFIDVGEEGSEAAAVTALGVSGSSEPVSEPFELKLNRPFFFAITDRTTGLIVFMGEVGNPAES
ncbi:serpin family protein [Saccharibacillus alkalitolerans]|uniref:Serpin family protein n=1 Tax=Saccharibacillus alkalitolerans TaxID=2705290 RepID=A0ABX0F2E1_9BACL|nr:serpin family protein [Saccharibacillus alkalitolerans]NGZ74119.1 serpin family protein [Saccharibacillus alkalitolerans]